MTAFQNYEFADLNDRPGLLRSVQQLEEAMKRELGQEVTIIAYTSPHSASHETECRAGLTE